jgi:hypothetical protein
MVIGGNAMKICTRVPSEQARVALAGIVAALLSGCASVPSSAPHFSVAPPAPAGYQDVYIYRFGAYPSKRTPTIAVDGKPVFDPPETAYTVIHLRPGDHWITTKWSWDTGTPPLSWSFPVKDTSVYIRLSGDASTAGFAYHVGTEIRGIPAEQAQWELRKCCRYVAVHGWDK